MNRTELKKNFHLLIDSIENDKLLTNFYDLIKKRSSAKEDQLWNRLPYKEQEELISAFEESEKPDYLTSHDRTRKSKTMESILIKPRDKAELNFFLELAHRLGSNIATFENDADKRLFQSMEYNSKTPRISKEKVLDTLHKIVKQ